MGSVYFATVGCPKNEVDTQVWLDCLSKSGYQILDNPNEADFLFINTCSFIDDARLESREIIEAMGEIKAAFPSKKLYIVGCWPQMDGERLLSLFPFADGIFGNRNILKSCESFMQLSNNKEQVVHLPSEICDWYPLRSFVPTTFPYAYLKIAEGCDNFCTYCTLPCIRGPYRSMPINMLAEQTVYLVEHGFKEIILVAQETTKYGQDLPDKPDLIQLLDRLDAIEGDFVIRLMYTNPRRIDRKLVEKIRDLPKMVKYLDIPLQHYDSELLELMRRGYSSDDIDRLIDMIKSVDSDIVLRTTFIAGFPGETDSKFEKLLKFIERDNFLHIGVFQYSPESGTAAKRYGNRIPHEVASLRKELIEMTQKNQIENKNRQLVGKMVDALVDRETVRDGFFTARMTQDAPEIDRQIKARGNLKQGEWARIRILRAIAGDFLGIAEEE